MKRKKITKLIVAAICLAAFSASAAFASNVARTITVYYQDIKMYVDGQRVNTSSEPFIYNGSTYLPVRAISEALGEEVYWDGNTKSVYIGERPKTIQYLMDVCPPYQSDSNINAYNSSSGNYFLMAGEKYYNGITVLSPINFSERSSFFNTNSQYSTVQFTYGPVDGRMYDDRVVTLSFVADGEVIASYDINNGDMPKTESLSLKGVNQLVIKVTCGSLMSYNSALIGVGNIIVS